jgi:hypothetical protein
VVWTPGTAATPGRVRLRRPGRSTGTANDRGDAGVGGQVRRRAHAVSAAPSAGRVVKIGRIVGVGLGDEPDPHAR